MSVLRGDFTGCSILIYDTNGEHLINTKIIRYDRDILRIMVEEPPVLRVGAGCKLLILTDPSPCEYQGRITKEGMNLFIAMYQGQEMEKRASQRYSVSFPAQIENLVCDGRAYPLHTPVEVGLMNISKSGIRFRAPNNTLMDGDRFQMRMKIGEGDKLLIADAIHHVDRDTGESEYGCKFLVGSERGA
jgi:hypothetical protein